MNGYCEKCETETRAEDLFCETCRKKRTQLPSESMRSKGKNHEFVPDSDGRYRWYYEVNMFSNPTIFITLCKVLGGVIIGCGLVIGLMLQADFLDTVQFILMFWVIGFGGFALLGTFSYVIYAAFLGGKYCVIFEMDKKSITHTQVAKQFKKAQVVAALTLLMGAARGEMTLMGTGILTGSRSSMQTIFKNVNGIKVKRHRNTIYLCEGLSWNQIYVEPENFEKVLMFMLPLIPATVKRNDIGG